MPDAPPVGLSPPFQLLGGRRPRLTAPTAFERLLGAIKLHQECLVAYRSSGGLKKKWVALDRARTRFETTLEILGCKGEGWVDAPEVEGPSLTSESGISPRLQRALIAICLSTSTKLGNLLYDQTARSKYLDQCTNFNDLYNFTVIWPHRCIGLFLS